MFNSLVKKFRGARVNAEDEEISLHQAAANGQLDQVKALLANGASVNAADNQEKTALYKAVYYGRTEIVKALLAAGADVNATKDDQEKTVLHWAVYYGYQEIVYALLNTKGIDVNAKDKYGSTALHKAADEGHTEIVQALLANGASVNAADQDGKTALHKAADEGHTEIIQALLANGASVNAADQDGKTALHKAADEGHTEIVQALLANGASVNAADQDGKTALHKAAEEGHTEIGKALLVAGASVNAVDNQEKTALYKAVYYGRTEIVKALLAAGADVNATKGDQEKTVLHWAVYYGHKDIILLLLVAGADPSLMNINGNIPTFLVNDVKITKFLAGAKDELKKIQDKKIGESKVLLSEFLLANEDNLIRYTHNSKLIQGLEGIKEQCEKDCPLFAKIIAEVIDAKCEVIDERRRLENEASNAMIRMCKLNGQKFSEDASRILVANIPNIGLKRLIVANVNAKDKGQYGRTPLHGAVLSGRIDEVNALLKKGAYINIRDDGGHVPLHLAAAKGNTEVIELLLKQKGVNVNAADKNRYTPLDYASHRGYHVFKGSHQGVIDALLAAGAKRPSTQMDRTQIAQEGASKKV